MMRFITQFMILACMLVTANIYAQSATDDVVAAPTQQTQPATPGPPAKQGPRQTQKPAPTFKPSEKISADSAVSFPVDI